MNADLEETLNGLGPEYRAVVARLRAAREVDVRRETGCAGEFAVRRETGCARGWVPLLAASLLAILALGVWLKLPRASRDPLGSRSRDLATASYGAREYRLTPEEMIATQRADGGWANDFLTRRNAEALKNIDDPRARVAYKRALRNLRFRQML